MAANSYLADSDRIARYAKAVRDYKWGSENSPDAAHRELAAAYLELLNGSRGPSSLKMPSNSEILLAAGEMKPSELAAVKAVLRWFVSKHNGPSLPEKPTMGMWDDFCTVFPVPFDQFERAAKLMLDGMRRDATVEKE